MINNEAALKYSNALFELGKEKDSLISFQEELDQVKELLDSNEEFQKVFHHKRILPDDKKVIINEIFSDQISKYVLNFIKLLIDNRREQFIEPIIYNFKKLVNKEEAIVEIKVITAVELTDDLKNQLLDKLNELLDYKIFISTEVDPEIIGGMVLQFNDFVVDGSIKKSLAKLQDKIKKVPVSMLGV
ncbi:MAG: ATP synthase F1 subunit delta [Halanaerobiaceae bacterium]